MVSFEQFYANGVWQRCNGEERYSLVDAVTGRTTGEVRFASAADLDVAVASARVGLRHWSSSTLADRRTVLLRLEQGIEARREEFIIALCEDIGCPVGTGKFVQAHLPLTNLRLIREAIDTIEWETMIQHSSVRRVPIGVVACLTPWNAPVHQALAKVAGIIAAGGALVLKPSEVAPRSAKLLMDVLDQIGLPSGVVNMIWGGADLGRRLVQHPGIDMVSFTGSEGVGRQVMSLAATDLKPVALELGGKSAAIVLRDADFPTAVSTVFRQTLLHSGQTCVCQSRLLVPEEKMESAVAIVRDTASQIRMGDPMDAATTLGPLATRAQYERVRAMVGRATADGAESVLDIGVPSELSAGNFFPPTAFANVNANSELAQREVFGPVLAMIGYSTEEHAVEIANGTPFGLSGAVWSAEQSNAQRVARQLRTGQVALNGAPGNLGAPAGGFGHSGFGRENGRFSIEAFTAYQAIHQRMAG